MAEEAIKKWIEEKLDEGVEKNRIKSILKDKGHDPSLVDEVESPFNNDENSSEEEEDDFDFSFADRQDSSEEETSTENKEDDPSPEPKSDEVESKFSMPHLSLNMGDRLHNLPVKGAALVLVILLGAGLAFTMMPDIGDVDVSSSTDSSNVLTQEIAFNQDDCPEDTGVRIESFTQDGNTITAEILVSVYGNGPDEADVVLELYSNEELVDSTSATLDGETELSVEGSGDELVLRPENCGEIMHIEEL